MKSRKEYLILIAVAAVLAVYLVFQRPERILYEMPEPAPVKEQNIERIVIEAPEETVELKKSDGRWRISPQGYPAAEAPVDRMLEILSSLELTAMVQESQSYHRYQLDEKHRITVEAFSKDGLLRSLAVGKAAPSSRHTFVKLPDDPRVYHAETNFRSRFEQTASGLRDKTVIEAFEKGAVSSIAISRKGETIELTRNPADDQEAADLSGKSEDIAGGGSADQEQADTPLWRNSEGDPVDNEKVARLLGDLSGLKCQNYLPERKRGDFAEPVYTVTVNADAAHTLSIFEKEEGNDSAGPYPAVSSGAPDPFVLPSHQAQEIMDALDSPE
jgi:hypothetical protein